MRNVSKTKYTDYQPMLQCKESLQPNRHLFNDRDTLVAVLLIYARAANEQTGEGMAMLYDGVKAPIALEHCSELAPFCMWGRDTTPLVSYCASNTIGSRGMHLDASAHGPFHDFVCDQLAFLTSNSTHHYYLEKTPAPTTAEVALFDIFNAYGLGLDRNSLFPNVWPILCDLGWCKEGMHVFFTPTGIKMLPTVVIKDSTIQRWLRQSSLSKIGIKENVHYFVNRERLVRDVFEYGPFRPDNYPALTSVSDLPFNAYVRLAVSVRHRLLYFLSGMNEEERQHMLDIAARHKSDLSTKCELE